MVNMPLVDYSSSDESETEDNENIENATKGKPISKDKIEVKNAADYTYSKVPLSDVENKLFSMLPSPKITFLIPNSTLKLLNKKQPVKIIINQTPSLIPYSAKTSTSIGSIFKKPVTPSIVKKPLCVNTTVNKDSDCSDKPESFLFSSSDINPKEIEPVDTPELKEEDKDDDCSDKPESLFFSSSDIIPKEIEPVSKDKVELKNGADYTYSKVPLSDVENKLLSMLPSPKITFLIPNSTLKLLNKKQPVKIINKTQLLIPDSVNKSTSIGSIFEKPVTPSIVKKPLCVNKTVNKEYGEDDDCSNKSESSLFSSSYVNPKEIEPVDMPEPKENATKSLFNAPENNLIEPKYTEHSMYPTASSSKSAEENMEVDNINQEALENLCGAGARKRRRDMPEEIIDKNVNSVVGEVYQMLSRDLTTEHGHISFKKPKNLSAVERRTNQITYLASQAKQRESEHRHQQTNRRITRKQTQSKYGF